MLPDRAGTYVLVLRLPRSAIVGVGQLGRFRFPAGWYTYAGSARGPGGLAARISRHLRSPKPLRWHVDYLRAYAQPVEVWCTLEEGPLGIQRRECAWAGALANLPGASIPAPRFGASDCRCLAHLVHFPWSPDLAAFVRIVGDAMGRGSARIVRIDTEETAATLRMSTSRMSTSR